MSRVNRGALCRPPAVCQGEMRRELLRSTDAGKGP